MSFNISCQVSAHLFPEDFSPYNAFEKVSLYPSLFSNSGPAKIYSFSLVGASR